MANTAASLVDHVLPKVPVRQWVLTLPYPLRYRCAWDAMLMSEVLRAFMRALFADQRRRARRVHGIERGHNGSVTFIQRFGSALNLTPHSLDRACLSFYNPLEMHSQVLEEGSAPRIFEVKRLKLLVDRNQRFSVKEEATQEKPCFSFRR